MSPLKFKTILCLIVFLGGETIPVSTHGALYMHAQRAAFEYGKAFQQLNHPSQLPDLTLEQTEDLLRKKLKSNQSKDAPVLARQIHWLCQRHGFRVSFVLSVIQAESGFNPKIVSNRGAIGLMQLRPIAAQDVADRYDVSIYKHASDLKNPWINVTLGVLYLKHLRSRFNNRMHYLSAYNLGPSKMQKLGVESRGVKHLEGVSRYIASIRKTETHLRERAAKENFEGSASTASSIKRVAGVFKFNFKN